MHTIWKKEGWRVKRNELKSNIIHIHTYVLVYIIPWLYTLATFLFILGCKVFFLFSVRKNGKFSFLFVLNIKEKGEKCKQVYSLSTHAHTNLSYNFIFIWFYINWILLLLCFVFCYCNSKKKVEKKKTIANIKFIFIVIIAFHAHIQEKEYRERTPYSV